MKRPKLPDAQKFIEFTKSNIKNQISDDNELNYRSGLFNSNRDHTAPKRFNIVCKAESVSVRNKSSVYSGYKNRS